MQATLIQCEHLYTIVGKAGKGGNMHYWGTYHSQYLVSCMFRHYECMLLLLLVVSLALNAWTNMYVFCVFASSW